MDFQESPLLNHPNLMLIILKVAARRDATIEDCAAALRKCLAEAHETMAADMRDVMEHLETCRRQLTAAGLLAPMSAGRFRLTARGREVLAANPMGVDDTVLMQFAEFRRHIRETSRHLTPDDPHIQEYDTGAEAFRRGRDLSANPYEPDTIKHQAWENGWYGARDGQSRW